MGKSAMIYEEINDLTDQDRLDMTIDRLISNLPEAIKILKAQGRHNLARQIINDLENLEYWQAHGGLRANG